jgi:hypothetical protein
MIEPQVEALRNHTRPIRRAEVRFVRAGRAKYSVERSEPASSLIGM